MSFTEIADLDCSNTIALGGRDKKTGKANPTKLEGYFIGSKQVESTKSKSGFAYLHVFQTPQGNVGVWGKTNLDQKLKSVKAGAMTRVTFVGMVETKNNPMYKYKVEVDSSNFIDVGAAIEEAIDAQDSSYGLAAEDSAYDDLADESLDAEIEEPAPARAKPPVRPAVAPSAARQAQVQALLNGRKAS